MSISQMDVQEITGVGALISAVALNVTEMITKVPVNGWFTLAMSLGGLVYLYWKIKNRHLVLVKDSQIVVLM